jgi:hypothetical protein
MPDIKCLLTLTSAADKMAALKRRVALSEAFLDGELRLLDALRANESN